MIQKKFKMNLSKFSLISVILIGINIHGAPVLANANSSSTYLAQAGSISSRKPVTIAVKEITNEAGNIWWWKPSLGKGLTDMLATELKDTGNFTVVERGGLNKVLDEQELAKLGITRKATAPKKGMMTGARYYILGSVSDYQENVESKGSGGGMSFMGFGGSSKKSEQKAYVAFDIRVIDTTTGEIAYTRTIEGTALSTQESKSSSSGFGALGGLVGGTAGAIGGTLSVSNEEQSSSKPPASKAIRAAMIEVSEYLNCILYLKDTCIDEYDAKNKARKAKTKDVLTF
jgi:curli biogenesis system outer membrane secretion channel CsgG